MEEYAEKIAAENGWKIIEISLRATNAEKPNRRMFYEAGVEEFLSLVKYAECVITNSFHGMILQYSTAGHFMYSPVNSAIRRLQNFLICLAYLIAC